jgi:hypothetical protein
MPQLRIVERRRIDGTFFIVQKKRWLFGWSGADMWEDWPIDSFKSLEEAKSNLWRWDGSRKRSERVVWP